MSAVPAIRQRILDGGLGIPATTPDLLHNKIGVCTKGPRLTPTLVTDVSTLVSLFGAGPLVDGAAYHIQLSGSLWVTRTATTNVGTIGAVTKIPVGAGTGTLAVALSSFSVHAVIAAGAPLNVTTGWSALPIPGLVSITLGAGGVATNYVITGKDLSGNVYTTTETVAAAGPGTFTSTREYSEIIKLTSNVDPTGTTTVFTAALTPADAYEVVVEILQSGSVAAQSMQFRYSLDNGRTFSNTLVVPASGVLDVQSYAPGSSPPYLGFKFTFADGAGPAFFLAGDKFTLSTTAPTWSLSALIDGMDAIANDPDKRQFYSGFHAVGAADGTVFTGVETQLVSYADTKFQYRFMILESVRQDSTAEATWAAAVVSSFNVTGVYTSVVAMDMNVYSPALRTYNRRNFGSVYTARLFACPISELPSHVDCETVYGTKTALDGVTKLYQGDASVTTLTLANIVTARQYATRTGFYITRGIQKTLDTSDYRDITNRRVMNVAATVGYDAALPFLQANLLANPATGRLDESEANNVKASIEGKERVVLLGGSRRHVSGLDVRVSTDNPFLQDRTLYTTIRIVPRGAVDFIEQTYSYAPSIT